MVDPPSPVAAIYQWNTGGCFTNSIHTVPTCFPTGQTTQKITGNNLLAEDAGTITCTVTIGGVDYTSRPLTLRISGMCIIKRTCLICEYIIAHCNCNCIIFKAITGGIYWKVAQ